MELGLNDKPKFPKGMEKYNGLTLREFITHHPLLLTTAIKKGGWQITRDAQLFANPVQPVMKKPGKHFV